MAGWIRRCCGVLAAVVLCGWGAAVCGAQTQPAFDVATVKPTPAVTDGRTHINYPEGGGFSASNVTLLGLMSWAFDMPAERILDLPGWAATQRIDIQAKTDAATDAAMRAMPGDEARARKRPMVQSLVVDRFGLKTHRETRTLNALDLVVDGKSKLAASTVSGKKWDSRRTSLRGFGLTADTLAERFSEITGKVVVNRTGLDGAYDVSLEWSPDDGSAPESNAPGFFRAVPEQLGLKLVSAKEPLEVLVVDAVREPTGN